MLLCWRKLQMHRLLKSQTFLLIKKNNSTCPPTPLCLLDPISVSPVLPQTHFRAPFLDLFFCFYFISSLENSLWLLWGNRMSTNSSQPSSPHRYAQSPLLSLLSSEITAVAIWLECGQSSLLCSGMCCLGRSLRCAGKNCLYYQHSVPWSQFFLLLSFLWTSY